MHLNLCIRVYKYLLVIAAHFKAFISAHPKTNKSANTAVEMLSSSFMKRYGIAEESLSNRRIEFKNKLFQKLSKLFGTKIICTISYRLRGNGLVEEMNEAC